MPTHIRPRFEHASELGHVPTVRHRMIAQALARYESPSNRMRDVEAIATHLLDPARLHQPAWAPRWTLATAYAPFEHVVDPSFPSTRLVFAQISAVMVDLQRLHSSVGPFIDPAVIREAQDATVIAGVLPSSNLARSDGTPPRRAFREAVDELLRTRKVEGRSLFEILLEVQAHRGDSDGRPLADLPACPNPSCGHALRSPTGEPLLFGEEGTCCPWCDEPILFTDALRAHETFREHGENREACGRVMSVAERLISLGFLDQAHARIRGNVGDIALITDGPLALFGEVAKFKTGILGRLQAIAAELREERLRLPVVVGIERSGAFAEHGRGIKHHIPPGTLMLPDEEYIERYITFRGSQYGASTYYGRHFFYRSLDRQMHTLTIPPLGRRGARPNDPFDPADYPTVACTCALIDTIGTRLYEDATIPLVLARRYCAFPAETAGEVLRLQVETHLGRPRAVAR
jgi:hypothetical protein